MSVDEANMFTESVHCSTITSLEVVREHLSQTLISILFTVILTVINQRVQHRLLRVNWPHFFQFKKKRSSIGKIFNYRSRTLFVSLLWWRKAINDGECVSRRSGLRGQRRRWRSPSTYSIFQFEPVTQLAGCPCDTAAHSRFLFHTFFLRKGRSCKRASDVGWEAGAELMLKSEVKTSLLSPKRMPL